MDKSKEYILMCEKAVEIQAIYKQRGLGENDFINRDKADPTREGFCIIIWLPRQDQLQGMIEAKDIAYLFDKFFEYYTLHWGIRSDCWWETSSMEQLWLAFVMSEKYNKVWTGKDWIKVK